MGLSCTSLSCHLSLCLVPFLGVSVVSVETPVDLTPASPGYVKKFIFTYYSAKALREHHFQEQGAHILAERGEKGKLGRLL